MRFIDFFAGIGGFRRGLELSGLVQMDRTTCRCSEMDITETF